jgi:hypothetical protein
LFGMGGQTSEKKAGAQEREEEKAEIAWILAFSNSILIYSRKIWSKVLFFPVFGFHSTSFFIFRGAKNPPLRPAE